MNIHKINKGKGQNSLLKQKVILNNNNLIHFLIKMKWSQRNSMLRFNGTISLLRESVILQRRWNRKLSNKIVDKINKRMG